jgi:hypothetical protein
MASGDPVQDAGGGSGDLVIPAWKLPPIVAAIAVSIVTGFYLGGPGLGLAVGGLAAASIVVIAVRHPPLRPIVPTSAPDLRQRLLVVLAAPLEDPAAVGEIATLAGTSADPSPAEILVLASAHHSFLDRWASDVERGRRQAQRSLVISLASLAGAGLDASARVGDENLVQAVEDELHSYSATAVVLITGPPGDDGTAPLFGAQLSARLRVPFLQLEQAPFARGASGVARRMTERFRRESPWESRSAESSSSSASS